MEQHKVINRLCYTGPAYGTAAQLLLEGMRRSFSKDYAHFISSKRMELVTSLWQDGFQSFWERAKRRRFGVLHVTPCESKQADSAGACLFLLCRSSCWLSPKAFESSHTLRQRDIPCPSLWPGPFSLHRSSLPYTRRLRSHNMPDKLSPETQLAMLTRLCP